MDPIRLPLEGTSPEVLKAFVDHLASNYMDILFKRHTGVIAVVEKDGVRQIVIFRNGCFHEQEIPHGPTLLRSFEDPGPFKLQRGNVEIRYMKVNGVRIEYEGTKVTRVVAANGHEIPFDPANEFWRFKVGPNQHHAEMKLLDWEEATGSKIVTASPTRGCCQDCLEALQKRFEDAIDDVVPKHRQTKAAFRKFKRDWDNLVKRLKAEEKLRAKTPQEFVVKPGAPPEMLPLAREAQLEITHLRAPNQKLLRISKYLKVAGPALLAFDAATSYAQAAEQWKTGARRAAADTLAEFGGRTAGALAGAELLGLLFGGFGSVVPGLGTTVGALVGGVIGGVVGAALGEQGAKELCHHIIDWAKAQSRAPGRDIGSTAASETPPGAGAVPRRYDNSAARDLQEEMYRAGYGEAAVDLVCGGIMSRPGESRPASQVFGQLASHIPYRAMDDAPLGTYPWVNAFDERVRQDGDPTKAPVNDTSRLPVTRAPDRPKPPPPISHRGVGTHGPNNAPRMIPTARAHDHRDVPKPAVPPRPQPYVTEEVTGEVIRPRPGAGQGTEDKGLVSEQASISARIDQVRQRMKSYADSRGGPTEMAARDADRQELRKLQDQQTMWGSSTDLATTMELTTLLNQLEQSTEFAKRDEAQQEHATRKLADDKRAADQQEALKARDRPPGEPRNTDSRPPASHDRVEDLEAQKRKDEDDERRAADERSRQEKEKEHKRENVARRRKEDEDKEAGRRRGAEDARLEQDAIANRDKVKGPNTTYEERVEARIIGNNSRNAGQTDLRRKHETDDARRKEADEARRKQEADEARRKQDADEARRKQEADEARRKQDADEARRKQEADEARRKQEADEARRKQEADEARRKQDVDEARRKQEADEARRKQEADEARRKQEADDTRRKQDAAVNGHTAETPTSGYEKHVDGRILGRGSQDAEQADQKQQAAEEARRLKEQRDAEEARGRLQERRDAEEARRLQEQRDAEEARRLKEQRDAEEARRLKEQRDAEEARRLKEQRDAEEARRRLQEKRNAENAPRRRGPIVVSYKTRNLPLGYDKRVEGRVLGGGRSADPADQRQQAAEAVHRRQQEQAAEDARRQQREQEAARRKQQDEEARRRQRDQEEARRKQQEQAAEEARRRQREQEEREARWQWERQEAERRRQEALRQKELARAQREWEQAQKAREREQRQVAIEAAKRKRDDERRQREFERQRWAMEKARRDQERADRQRERERQERERELARQERERRQRDRDQRRYSSSLSGRILGRGARRGY